MSPTDDVMVSESEACDRILHLLTATESRPEALGTIIAARRLQVPPGAIAPCLLDPSEATRLLAIEALCTIGAPAVNELIGALSPAQPPSVRVGAAMALGRLGPDAAPAAAALAACLRPEEPLLCAHAGLALSQIGPDAVAHVLPLLEDPDGETVRTAATVLGRIGEGAGDSLDALQNAAAQSPSPYARMACCWAMSTVSKDPALGLLEILPLLDEEDPLLRIACLDAIRESGTQEEPVREKVHQRVHDVDGRVRKGAALTLARVEPDVGKALPPLLSLLADEDPDVRAHAVMALAHYGTQAAAATGSLETLQHDDAPHLRAVVTAALARIRGEDAE